MDQQLADSLSRQLRISPEQIVREEREMLVLRELMESSIGAVLVFKGGTALRLAFGSPRFSDDLDFSLLAPIAADDFQRVAQAAAKSLAQVDLVEALSKQFTMFASYRVREPYLSYPFTIKVEVSTRPQAEASSEQFELRLLSSPTTPVSVLAQVAPLARMWSDKQEAFARRQQPRDLYDLWFIAQKLQLPFAPDLAGLEREGIKRELRKYLPANHWQVIDLWTK